MNSCVIIDDEQMSIDILKQFIFQHDQLSLQNTFTNPMEAIAEIPSGSMIDFLFLDIRMDVSGLDIALLLRDRVRYLIFVTGYEHYALDAFSVNCDGYLVKPVDFKKLGFLISHLLERDCDGFNAQAG